MRFESSHDTGFSLALGDHAPSLRANAARLRAAPGAVFSAAWHLQRLAFLNQSTNPMACAPWLHMASTRAITSRRRSSANATVGDGAAPWWQLVDDGNIEVGVGGHGQSARNGVAVITSWCGPAAPVPFRAKPNADAPKRCCSSMIISPIPSCLLP